MFHDIDDHHHHRLRHLIHAIGQHRGRHGFRRSPGAGDGRGGFMGGDGMPGGRKLGSADLQLVLLALLAAQPAHGYELIRMLEERSGGFYTPSPGMIYPALTYLDEIGQATATPEGNRKLYALTDAGRSHLAANQAQADTILDALARIGGRMEQVREAFAGVGDHDAQGAEDLHRSRHALKHALMRMRGCTPEEGRRIARILDHATAEILKGRG